MGSDGGRRVGEDDSFTVMHEDAIGCQLYKLFEAIAGTRRNHPSSADEPLVRGSAE